MLPPNHAIVTARAHAGGPCLPHLQLPYSTVFFSPQNREEVTPEELLTRIPAYPQHVKFFGNPLHQEIEFLRLVLVELTNRGHIVIIEDRGDRNIPWKLIMPGVRLRLSDPLMSNFRKLRECDTVLIGDINDAADYEIVKTQIQHIRDTRLSPCQISLSGKWSALTGAIIDDSLEVLVDRSRHSG